MQFQSAAEKEKVETAFQTFHNIDPGKYPRASRLSQTKNSQNVTTPGKVLMKRSRTLPHTSRREKEIEL